MTCATKLQSKFGHKPLPERGWDQLLNIGEKKAKGDSDEEGDGRAVDAPHNLLVHSLASESLIGEKDHLTAVERWERQCIHDAHCEVRRCPGQRNRGATMPRSAKYQGSECAPSSPAVAAATNSSIGRQGRVRDAWQ
jgi:hypothetical protein